MLSSPDRVGMLSALLTEKLRLSRLSGRVSISVQEASRQVARLQEANLVVKGSDGLFSLTSYGRSVLKLLPSFDFLVSNRDYMLSHDLSFLPPGFVERIGELAPGEYGGTVGDILRHFQELMGESRRYVWLMADQVLLLDSVAEKALRNDGVSMRVVIPEKVEKEGVHAELVKGFRGDLELGLVASVNVGMALNESLAGVIFPDRAGRVDFNAGFRSRRPEFHAWCVDLFSYYWDRAKKVDLSIR